MGFTTFQQVQV